MKIICAWCGAVLQEGEGEISHGICRTCKEKTLAELKRKLNLAKEEK